MPFRPPKTANQLRLFAKAKEREAVKKYTQDWDPLNLYWAQYFLDRRALYGDNSIQLCYAREVMARLRPNAN